jgi:HEXXH motif-containing protein
MWLLDHQTIIRLKSEFCLSMRRLLADLCRELHADHASLARELGVPISFFDRLLSSFSPEVYSNWKVVGWIETLNDLVYFLDILKQWTKERDQLDFAAQLFEECQAKFFEHGYFDELFPGGKLRASGLGKRLLTLCRRLAQESTQEALWFDPVVPVLWCQQQRMGQWNVPGTLKGDFERAEIPGILFVENSGSWCETPKAMRQALHQSAGRVTFQVKPTGISLKAGKTVSTVWSRWHGRGQWQWVYHLPMVTIDKKSDPVTVGPTLVYGKNRQPKTVRPTDQRQVVRITRAWQTIRMAWPEGHELLNALTSRIIPLRAKGVVSFSYRHRPGLSFINCFDRGHLDLLDDLIHENGHHHLNLLLRKYVMYRGDHNQQIFYSPWRRSLRPLRGILHATFTFTMGALLFERLSSWAEGRGGMMRWKKAGLTPQDLQRARFRCLEEIESVRYSIQDLCYADHHLGWLTGSGRRMVGQLAEAIEQVECEAERFKRDVLRSRFGPALRRHIDELKNARQRYGPIRLSRA